MNPSPSAEPATPPTPPEGRAARRLRSDGLFVSAYIVFVALSGVLVFGFASALGPAVDQQGAGACRAMQSEPRGGSFPEFSALDRAGEAVHLEDLRGRFVVLNFWATWCEPCTREWPEIDKLSRRLQGREDVVVVAVSLDEEGDKVEPYLASMSLAETPVRVWRDPTGETNGLFGGEKLPDTYFVNERGEFIDAFINVRSWGSSAGVQCVDSRVGRAR